MVRMERTETNRKASSLASSSSLAPPLAIRLRSCSRKLISFYGRGIFTAVFLTGFFIFEYVVEFNNLAGL